MPLFRPRRNRMLIMGHGVLGGSGYVGSTPDFGRNDTPISPDPAARFWVDGTERYWDGGTPREWI